MAIRRFPTLATVAMLRVGQSDANTFPFRMRIVIALFGHGKDIAVAAKALCAPTVAKGHSVEVREGTSNRFGCAPHGTRISRKLALLPREEHEWLAAGRLEQRTSKWKQKYNKRAGNFGRKIRRSGSQPMNAKAETVATASSFREAFRKGRCLVPADAFLE
jgi:SOS response associated peptidase (SRAP)